MSKKRIPFMLSADKGFIPVTIDEADEYFANGIFIFNITKMLKFINGNKNEIQCEEISVLKYRKENHNLNDEYLELTDLSKPVILAEICPGIHNMIDGHHRIESAYRKGIDSIVAYMLKPA